jgi:hypothetical protein
VGVLITHTDEVWYLWKEANEEVAVIPDTALAEVNLTYPASKAGKTPATLLVRHVLGAI